MKEVTNNSRWSVLAIAERWRFYKIFSDCISKEINTDDGLESYIAYVQMLIKKKELKLINKTKKTDVSYILGKDVKHIEKKYFNHSTLNNKKIKINNYDQPDISHKKIDIDLMLDEWIYIDEVIERWEILSPKDKYEDYWLECLWELVKNGIVKIYDSSYNEYIDYSHLNPFGRAFGSSGGNFTSELLKREDMIKAEIKLGFRRMLPNEIQHPDNYKYEQPQQGQVPQYQQQPPTATAEQIEFYESKTPRQCNRYDIIKKIINAKGWKSYGKAGDVTVKEIEIICRRNYPQIFPKDFNRVWIEAKKAGCVLIKEKKL